VSAGSRPGARTDVLVVGGGLAGIAAALRCADGGRTVTLVEGRPRLGGAAFSFRRGPLTIDNGQHVFLRCCTAYQELLARIGATDSTVLQEHLDIPVLSPDGRRARLRRTPHIPAPGHLSAALARFSLLSPTDRLRAVRGALALRLLDPADARLDRQSLGGYLRRHGQTDAVIDTLWGVVATATLNLPPDDASLALAAKVFRTGLLDSAPAADVGYASVPLGEIHGTAARSALERAGVEVVVNARVDELAEAGAVSVRTRSGTRTYAAETVILAVPPRDALRLAPQLAHTTAGRAGNLRTSPIVNVHVIYDRAVTDLPFAAAVHSPVQWLFDRTHSSGAGDVYPGSQYLAITVSAADAIIDTPSPTLQARFVDELAALLPRARAASVLDAFVTRERNATFRQEPGSATLRPGPDSGLPGVWLAGSWTDTGWPDTMESAVRSGVRAADAALETATTGRLSGASADVIEFST
jgi:squalene-associated FAD-dependent desaturase